MESPGNRLATNARNTILRYDGALDYMRNASGSPDVEASVRNRKAAVVRSIFNPATSTLSADGAEELPTHGDGTALEQAIRERVEGKVFNICVSVYRENSETVHWSLSGIFK